MQKLQDESIIPFDPSSSRMPYIDGSVGADVPLHRVAELFNVNTFLVSQVNPYTCTPPACRTFESAPRMSPGALVCDCAYA